MGFSGTSGASSALGTSIPSPPATSPRLPAGRARALAGAGSMARAEARQAGAARLCRGNAPSRAQA
jgi:hypothetical protein